MSALQGIIRHLRTRLDSRWALAILVLAHSAMACVSMIKVASFQSYIHFNIERLWIAVAVAAVYSAVALLFILARFSLGYLAGFYFYTMILGSPRVGQNPPGMVT